MEEQNQNLDNHSAPTSTEPKKWYKSRWVLVIAVLALVAGTSVWAYFEINQPQDLGPVIQNHQPDRQLNPPNLPSANPPPFSSLDATTTTVNVRQQKIIKDQYGLFALTKYDTINNASPTTEYQEDGIIDSGRYAGYHRLAAFREFDEPGGGDTFIFATKDYQIYVIDAATSTLADADSFLNKNKVVIADSIPLAHPETIDLGDFILTRDGVKWDADVSDNLMVASSLPSFKFFAERFRPQQLSGLEGESKKLFETQSTYFFATSNVVVQDKYGLPFSYSLRSKEMYNRLKQDYTDRYQPFYMNGDLNLAQVYSSYGKLLPGGCDAVDSTYILQNISDRDLVKITNTKTGLDIYTLKNQSHPLNSASYFAKVTMSGDSFQSLNNGVAIPSFQAYVAKNPVLLVKDPWNRWLGLGEYQYQLEGGCGKPVIYLYPTSPTRVTVKFKNPMRFTADIPFYAGQWEVLANPNGDMKDLQPQFTDCAKINTTLEGSEYAGEACQTGLYPYLYWAGQTSGDYPKASGGWIVARENVADFLSAKLIEIGLNEQERSDMLGFWVPELLKKDAPYYRLSFFQTQQMNKFVPMEVTPTPDTVFRIFLDWSPLQGNLGQEIPPQILQKLVRKGFTLVEWGGLKQ